MPPTSNETNENGDKEKQTNIGKKKQCIISQVKTESNGPRTKMLLVHVGVGDSYNQPKNKNTKTRTACNNCIKRIFSLAVRSVSLAFIVIISQEFVMHIQLHLHQAVHVIFQVSATVFITIEDINDNTPTFQSTPYQTRISEVRKGLLKRP